MLVYIPFTKELLSRHTLARETHRQTDSQGEREREGKEETP